MKFVQMYRISFTTVDKIRRRVFFFIGRDRESKKLLMHILQCKTKRQVGNLQLSVRFSLTNLQGERNHSNCSTRISNCF